MHTRTRAHSARRSRCVGALQAGWAGCTADPSAIEDASLWTWITQHLRTLPHSRIRTSEGVLDVPYYVVGDGIFKCCPTLIIPYNSRELAAGRRSSQALHRSMVQFNHDHSGTRMAIERAFGVLKGRWRCLKSQLDFNHIYATRVIVACAVLHNMCQLQGEQLREILYSRDTGLDAGYSHAYGIASEANRMRDGRAVRDHLRTYLDDVWDGGAR